MIKAVGSTFAQSKGLPASVALLLLFFTADAVAQPLSPHPRFGPLPFICTPDSARQLMRRVPDAKYLRKDSIRVPGHDTVLMPVTSLLYTGGNYNGVRVRETRLMFWRDSLVGLTYGFAAPLDPTLMQRYEELRAKLIAELGSPSSSSADDVSAWRATRSRSERRSRQDSILFTLCMQGTIPLVTRWDGMQNGRRTLAMLRVDQSHGFVLGYYDTELLTERIPQFVERLRNSGGR